ncbi:excinuclease ABC subunit UvrC, partial [Peptoniphilus sp.]|uniref:excinuclease ABC subunit UvrC n=1 Tax=Peptoniphilus sp. TaxID=1971214 RepID=UPI003D8B4C05
MKDLREKLDKLPDKPGVYIMKNELDEIIYVGKAKSLRKRVRQYFGSYGKSSKKVANMVSKINDFEYIIVENEVESLVLESNLIKNNLPKYNILLRDDKQYPYIKVTTNQRYPRVLKTRRIEKDKAKYFGPYPDIFAVNDSLDTFEMMYPLRTCNLNLENVEEKNYRPCLNYYIGKCMGPCIGNVDDDEYNKMVDEVLNFLSSSNDELIKKLNAKMFEYSEKMEYENAADIRDRIKNLEYLKERQLISDPEARDDKDIIALAKSVDEALVQIFFFRNGKIIGREHYLIKDYYNDSYGEILSSFMKQFYIGASYIPKEIIVEDLPTDFNIIEKWLSERRGNKVTITMPVKGNKKELVRMVKRNAIDMIDKYGDRYSKRVEVNKLALEEIQDLIHLDTFPNRIEAYDISNISGVESVGSMVVFENGDSKKSDYRKFRIKTVVGADDYGSHREILTRRFKRGVDEKKSLVKSSFSSFPDLIMMDGGKGQVNVAKEVLESFGLDIPVCGLVKDDFHTTRGIIYNNVEYGLPIDSRGYKMIYKIQEEMHR